MIHARRNLNTQLREGNSYLGSSITSLEAQICTQSFNSFKFPSKIQDEAKFLSLSLSVGFVLWNKAEEMFWFNVYKSHNV